MKNENTREKALSALITESKAGKERGREMATWGLLNASESRLNMDAAVSACGEGLKDRNDVVKLNSALTLLTLAEAGRDIKEALPNLGKGLSCKDEMVRIVCAKTILATTLKGNDSTAIIEDLRRAVSDPNPEIARCALESIKANMAKKDAKSLETPLTQ